ncbi:MAG: hypothetical protein N4A53_13910 [Pelagimonas sp.]|nr:hypothetical protein [Pelagimonas sp.]
MKDQLLSPENASLRALPFFVGLGSTAKDVGSGCVVSCSAKFPAMVALSEFFDIACLLPLVSSLNGHVVVDPPEPGKEGTSRLFAAVIVLSVIAPHLIQKARNNTLTAKEVFEVFSGFDQRRYPENHGGLNWTIWTAVTGGVSELTSERAQHDLRTIFGAVDPTNMLHEIIAVSLDTFKLS